MIIKVKPQAKKAKVDPEKPAECLEVARRPDIATQKPSANSDGDEFHPVANSGLVSYSDESDEDD